MTQSDNCAGKPKLTFSDDGEPILIPHEVEKEMFKLNETEKVEQPVKKPPVRGPRGPRIPSTPGTVRGVRQKEKPKDETPTTVEEPNADVVVETPTTVEEPNTDVVIDAPAVEEPNTDVVIDTPATAEEPKTQSKSMALSEFTVSVGSSVSDIQKALFEVAKKYYACIHTTINIKGFKYFVASVACVVGGVRVLLRNSAGTSHVCLMYDGVSFKEEHCVCDGQYFTVKDLVVAHVEPYSRVIDLWL